MTRDPASLEQPCVVCRYDLRHDPLGSCPECGTTRSERDRVLARQGQVSHQQSQRMLLALGWMVILAMTLSCIAGMLMMIMGD